MFGPGNFHEVPRPFSVSYRCYSVSMLPGNERLDVENGGKIILPPSALEHLTRLNVAFPMLFKMTHARVNRSTHCGVLEFVADEGRCYIPYWMMSNLMCDEGEMIQIESATLPVASFSKFEPQSAEFLNITNPKAMLENALRSFACLTSGDMIAIRYNDKLYELRVLETRPGTAVSIIECDMEVEFATPVDYIEPTRKAKVVEEGTIEMEIRTLPTFVGFAGSGNREMISSDSSCSTKKPNAEAVMSGMCEKGLPLCSEGEREVQQRNEMAEINFPGPTSTAKGRFIPPKRTYGCDVCTKSFTFKGALTRHKREQHDNKEPLICDVCRMTFFRKDALKKHIEAVHLNLREYKCYTCNKYFAQKGNMRFHYMNQHRNKGKGSGNGLDEKSVSVTNYDGNN